MEYKNFKVNDFLKDEYFQKWVLDPNPMTDNFWNNWLMNNPKKKEELDEAKRWVQLMAKEGHMLSEHDFASMWQNIIERQKLQEYKIHKQESQKYKYNLFYRAAAIFIGLITISYGLYQWNFNSHHTEPNTSPDMPQVTLELQDGTIKVINEKDIGTIKSQNGHSLISQKLNRLIYDNEDIKGDKALSYNQLNVPYGKKFEITLSDGSHVILNSGSKFRYPVMFLADGGRNVFLEGEAFFSVAKDSNRLFTVITDDMNTQVYGTKFNVSSYKNDLNTFVVLNEGSIGVYQSNNATGEQPIGILPGQRATFEDGRIEVDEVDVRKYSAWTQGELYFVDDRFELILRELERHFNVHIDNKFTKLNDKKFTGKFGSEPLEKILRICQEHTPFQYSINGDSITIKQ